MREREREERDVYRRTDREIESGLEIRRREGNI